MCFHCKALHLVEPQLPQQHRISTGPRAGDCSLQSETYHMLAKPRCPHRHCQSPDKQQVLRNARPIATEEAESHKGSKTKANVLLFLRRLGRRGSLTWGSWSWTGKPWQNPPKSPSGQTHACNTHLMPLEKALPVAEAGQSKELHSLAECYGPMPAVGLCRPCGGGDLLPIMLMPTYTDIVHRFSYGSLQDKMVTT